MKKSRLLGAMFAASLVFSIPAHAVVVTTVGGTSYDVTTVVGGYADVSGTLMSQDFWADGPLAEELATLVDVALGTPNGGANGVRGPLFAVCDGVDCLWDSDNTKTIQGWSYRDPDPNPKLWSITEAQSAGATWAVATVVPVPAAVWLFGSGLIGLVGIARRKKA